eukprot:5560946-Amphidinium_carterae.1
MPLVSEVCATLYFCSSSVPLRSQCLRDVGGTLRTLREDFVLSHPYLERIVLNLGSPLGNDGFAESDIHACRRHLHRGLGLTSANAHTHYDVALFRGAAE